MALPTASVAIAIGLLVRDVLSIALSIAAFGAASGFRAVRRHWIMTALGMGLAVILVDLIYLWALWPDWGALASGPAPKSRFIAAYEETRALDPTLPRLRWKPVPLPSLPRYLPRAVILAEDSRFYQHHGIDWNEVAEAAQTNLDRNIPRGASTISQQTVKNLFLSPSRTPWRKWHELVLTWALERRLSKQRILSLYLNIAEFGRGLYGIEAAARAYYDVGAASLSVAQAAELAATLPSPVRHNPASRTRVFTRRRDRILALLERFGTGVVRPQPRVDSGVGNDELGAPPRRPTDRPPGAEIRSDSGAAPAQGPPVGAPP